MTKEKSGLAELAHPEIKKSIDETSSCEPAKSKVQKLMDEETKLVKGRFRNFETPGTPLKVQIKKYKEVPMFDMVMEDNKIYEVPLYVARHLNGVDACAEKIGCKTHSCSYPVHGFQMGKTDALPSPDPRSAEGIPVPIIGVDKYVRRYGFDSLEFGT